MKPPRLLHRRQRGISLMEALVGLALLGFGLLGLTKLQARVIGNATESQHRMAATLLADELLNMMLVDNINVACYTLPAAGTCDSAAARARTTAWNTRATGADGGLPGTATATSTLDAANNRLTVTLSWQFKGGDTRTHEVSSDIRANK